MVATRTMTPPEDSGVGRGTVTVLDAQGSQIERRSYRAVRQNDGDIVMRDDEVLGPAQGELLQFQECS